MQLFPTPHAARSQALAQCSFGSTLSFCLPLHLTKSCTPYVFDFFSPTVFHSTQTRPKLSLAEFLNADRVTCASDGLRGLVAYQMDLMGCYRARLEFESGEIISTLGKRASQIERGEPCFAHGQPGPDLKSKSVDSGSGGGGREHFAVRIYLPIGGLTGRYIPTAKCSLPSPTASELRSRPAPRAGGRPFAQCRNQEPRSPCIVTNDTTLQNPVDIDNVGHYCLAQSACWIRCRATDSRFRQKSYLAASPGV